MFGKLNKFINNFKLELAQKLINSVNKSTGNVGSIKDGQHTFDELYFHRMILFSVICSTYKDLAWKSKLHHDGTMFEGYFIIGIDTPTGQFSYHYENMYWDVFNDIEELEMAPVWDGHVASDVKRLYTLLEIKKGCDIVEMVKLKHDLLTTKYTEVEHEKEFKFDAPHHFAVNSKEQNTPLCKVDFQEGPIKENGVNGICNEDLIAMVICRLEHFQNSEFCCRDNEMAIAKLEEALLWLRKRTIGRENRGVEGTSVK